MPLTAKQEAFAQEWFATGNKSEAYRRAYPKSRNWKESTVNTQASVLSRNSKVLARFEELAKAAQERNETSVDLIDKMLKNAYQVAKNDMKGGQMVAAAMGLSKLHGFDAEVRYRMSQSGEFDMESPPLRIEFSVRPAVAEVETTNASSDA